MTPGKDTTAANGPPPSAASLRLAVLKKRAQFQRASRGKRVAKPGFIVQMVPADAAIVDDPQADIGVGFTCSKKVGNAVARNRAKRRLREIARLELPHSGLAGQTYVLIGRQAVTASMPFDTLRQDLRAALAVLHGNRA